MWAQDKSFPKIRETEQFRESQLTEAETHKLLAVVG